MVQISSLWVEYGVQHEHEPDAVRGFDSAPALALEPIPPSNLRSHLERDRRLEYRWLDVQRRIRMVDDEP